MTLSSFLTVVGTNTALSQCLTYFSGSGIAVYKAYFISIAIQFIVFLHASGIFGNAPTEKYFDLTGSATFVTLILTSIYMNNINNLSERKLVLSGFVLVWALRLGSFLFTRIKQAGGIDSRFTEVKKSVFRFATFWALQGLWVFLTSFPVLQVLSFPKSPSNFPTKLDILGMFLWGFGFLFEVVADYQKTAFRALKSNHSKFINTGLWSISRHPNYFGEILLWIGLFIVACSEYTSPNQYLSIVSPLFVSFLLSFVSGVPLLEKAADKTWGKDPLYIEYKKKTSVLVPFL